MKDTFINYFDTPASTAYELPNQIEKFANKNNAEPVSVSHSYYNGIVSALVIFQPRRI